MGMVRQEQYFDVILNIFLFSIIISFEYLKANFRFKNLCEGLPINSPAYKKLGSHHYDPTRSKKLKKKTEKSTTLLRSFREGSHKIIYCAKLEKPISEYKIHNLLEQTPSSKNRN